MRRRPVLAVLVAIVAATAGCGDDEEAADDGMAAFCDAWNRAFEGGDALDAAHRHGHGVRIAGVAAVLGRVPEETQHRPVIGIVGVGRAVEHHPRAIVGGDRRGRGRAAEREAVDP